MLVSQGDVRSRIEEINLGNEGYKRQLRSPAISTERRERLETEVALMEEELATLEKIAQLGRVEEDRDKIEVIVKERLGLLQDKMKRESATSGLRPEEYGYASGEVEALMWALGQDQLLKSMSEASNSRAASQSNPAQYSQSVTTMLVRALREGAERDTRASAAYDIGRIHLAAALPELAAALNDHPQVASVALQALRSFSEAELIDARIPEEVLRRILDQTKDDGET